MEKLEEAVALLTAERDARIKRAQDKLQALLTEEKCTLQTVQVVVNGMPQEIKIQLVAQ